ncbi:MAG: efflux RND transporter periplasmic adaptor subunit, partial [Phormidesmis sp.]
MTYQDIHDNEELPVRSQNISGKASGDRAIELIPPSGGKSGWLSGPKGLLIGLVMGLGLAFGGARLAQQRSASEPAPPIANTPVASASVTTARAKGAPIKETITASGTVQAFDLLSVSPRASGLQIQSVTVREGDRVSQGQVLAVLDDSVLQAQLEQAKAQVSAAQAQVAQEEAAAAQSRATAAEAQEKYGRYASLYKQGAISQEELATRRTQLATASEAVGSSTAAIDSAEATVRSRQAEVSQLMTQLDQTQVLAPASGIIAEKNATVGDTAAAGTPMFKIISGDQLELALSIPQTQLSKVGVGAAVQVSSSADPNLQLQGSVRSIDPVVDAQSRKATVKVSLPGSDRLRPGMFLQAAIVTGSREGVVVPAEAVLPQSGGGFVVYTLNADGMVKANAVEVGERSPAAG